MKGMSLFIPYDATGKQTVVDLYMRRGSTNCDGFVHEEGSTNRADLYMRMERQTVVDLYMKME